MWESGRNEKGRPLSKFEVQALGERWCELFGCLPPTLGTNSFPPTPAEPESQDDTILGMREVRRMTGLSTSTIKRQMGKTFPAPTKISVRRIGWPAHKIKAWQAEREVRLER